MISLVPLAQDPATVPDPKAPVTQRITVRALSTWNALILGVVTGFALSAGTLLFDKLARRAGWK